MRLAALVIALAMIAMVGSCGGATAPAATPAAALAEDFGPGLVAHASTVEVMSKEAARVLAAAYTVAPGDTPGVMTTEWAEHDARRWPGLRTRVVVEVTADRVIVRVQCRAEKESCARTLPADVDLVALARRLAADIVGSDAGGLVLAKVVAFKNDICACRDWPCVDQVEKAMMAWAMTNMDQLRAMKPTLAQDEAADAVEAEVEACKAKLGPRPASSRPSIKGSPGSTGSPECDEYLITFDKVVDKCADKLGPSVDVMKQSRDAQAEAFAEWAKLDEVSFEATVEAASAGCKSATDAIRQSATAMGCKL